MSEVNHEESIMKTPDTTLISALAKLANDIQCDDGVANACIAEAAQRLREHGEALEAMKREFREFDEIFMTFKTAMKIIDKHYPRVKEQE